MWTMDCGKDGIEKLYVFDNLISLVELSRRTGIKVQRLRDAKRGRLCLTDAEVVHVENMFSFLSFPKTGVDMGVSCGDETLSVPVPTSPTTDAYLNFNSDAGTGDVSEGDLMCEPMEDGDWGA